jgi:ABC-2 type transport system permease protein
VTATAAESATATGGPKAPRPLRIVERSLRDRRRGLVFWAIGIATYVALIVAFWPSIRGDSAMSEAIKNYPDVMKEFFGGAASFDYTKPGGFLNTQLFSLMAPLFLAAFAIGYAASIVAGEERDGQLDLVLSTPVSRQRILLEKALAVALGVGALTLVTLGVILGVGVAVDLGIGVANVVAACGGAGLVALVYGSLTLAVAAATGNRSLAIGIGWAAFAAGYLLEALSGLVSGLKPLRVLSAIHFANGGVPIINGFSVANNLVLVVVSLVFVAVARFAFERRDLGV